MMLEQPLNNYLVALSLAGIHFLESKGKSRIQGQESPGR